MGNINSEIESLIYELLLHPYSAAEYVNPIILVVSSLGLILFAAVVIGTPIALIIACVCNTRYARKFGFPTCSWMNPTTKIRCICCPSCYCVGVHANPDRSGSLITLPCEECCYTILHCSRPPPELIKTAELHGNVAVASQLWLPVYRPLTHSPIAAILNAEPVSIHHHP